MKQVWLFLSVWNIVFSGYSQKFEKVHRQSIVVDSHNDIITTALEKHISFDQHLKGITHSDLDRLKEGGIDVQVFSIWCDGTQPLPFAYANRQIDTLVAWSNRNPGTMQLVTNPGELKQAVRQNKLAAMIGVEGGHMMENDLLKLDSLYNRGTRYMTLTWNNSNPWATSAMEETNDTLLHQPKGLSDFGRKVIARMNGLGMMLDLSHVGEQTFKDAMAVTTKPVIVSHSCVYKLCPVFRNLKDDQIKAVAKNGGVIQVNFYSLFLDSNFTINDERFMKRHKAERDSMLQINPSPTVANDYLYAKYKAEFEDFRAPFDLLIDHIDYIVKLAGIDHVGLGSDFDGINSTPRQLDDVTSYPLITKALFARGYSKRDVKKILGLNFMRVFAANSK